MPWWSDEPSLLSYLPRMDIIIEPTSWVVIGITGKVTIYSNLLKTVLPVAPV